MRFTGIVIHPSSIGMHDACVEWNYNTCDPGWSWREPDEWCGNLRGSINRTAHDNKCSGCMRSVLRDACTCMRNVKLKILAGWNEIKGNVEMQYNTVRTKRFLSFNGFVRVCQNQSSNQLWYNSPRNVTNEDILCINVVITYAYWSLILAYHFVEYIDRNRRLAQLFSTSLYKINK